MRILVDARHLIDRKPTGIGQYLYGLLNPLTEIGNSDQFIFWTSGKKSSFLSSEILKTNTHQYHSKHSNRLFTLKSASPFRNSIEEILPMQFDVAFFPHIHAFPKSQKTPTVLTVHDLTWLLFPELYSKKMQLWHKIIRAKRSISEAQHLITPSESTASDLAALFPKKENSISVIPHGYNNIFTSKKTPQDSGIRSKYRLPKRFALFVGTIEPRKNIWTIIEGIKRYEKTTGNKLPIVFVGKWGWNTKPLKKLIASLPNARIVGYLPEKEQSAFYRLATVLIWPSVYEGFGLPPLEALASGCPVITSNNSSLPSVIDRAGILINPFDINDLAEALTFLLSDQVLYNKYVEKGILQARNFSYKTAAEKTYEIIKQVAG